MTKEIIWLGMTSSCEDVRFCVWRLAKAWHCETKIRFSPPQGKKTGGSAVIDVGTGGLIKDGTIKVSIFPLMKTCI
jgi:hypothetical protein